ncbi:MAG: sulfite exporter TauE/SafE family protein, partial [Clostridium sp.]
MDFKTILLFALIIMCAYFIEGLIGFGGTVIAIPVASLVLDLKVTISVLTIVVLLASLIIAVRDFKYINKKQYVKIISIMIFGLPIGIWLFASLPEKPLKVALGIFMIYMSVKGIYNSTEKRKTILSKIGDKPRSKGGNIIDNILIFFGGVVHGAFSCGGPLVVVYATKNIKDKTSFRATLCALWSTLNA